jgi:hypothetical protein
MQPLKNGTRQFTVHGIISKNTDFIVYRDNTHPIADGSTYDLFYPNIGPVLYRIDTSTDYFGYVPIKIIVNSGTIHLTRSRAVYPGKFYNQSGEIALGTYYQFQPYDPKFLIRINGKFFEKPEADLHLTGEYEYTIKAGDVFEYYHLIYSAYADFISLVYDGSPLPNNIDISDNKIIEALDESPTLKMEYLKEELLQHHALSIDVNHFKKMYLSTVHGVIQQNKNINQRSL